MLEYNTTRARKFYFMYCMFLVARANNPDSVLLTKSLAVSIKKHSCDVTITIESIKNLLQILSSISW